jgi:hypothetical protein
VDGRGVNRKRGFHNKVEPSIRPDQQSEIRVLSICAVSDRPRSGNIKDPLRIFENIIHAKLIGRRCGVSRNRAGNLRTLPRPKSSNWCMQISGMKAADPLRHAYRTTFDEYACKLDALQRLIDSEGTDKATDKARLEAAIQEADAARRAHNSARDLLAAELAVEASLKMSRRELPVQSAPAVDDRIRETAQLLWEFAGRPQGTAERDWCRAEQLVQAAAASR